MDTSHHVNGHGKKLVDHHSATHVARKAIRRGKRVGKKLENKATAVARMGERQLTSSARGVVAWVKANPKTAIGIGLGFGVAASVLANSKIARAAMLSLGGLAFAAFKRFV